MVNYQFRPNNILDSYKQKEKLQEKNINPNPKDSDQRGRERLKPWRPRQTQACEPQAWVACGLGLPGSRTVV